MKFEFAQPTSVKLTHINVRAEKHGDESATALDLKFTRTDGNSVLALFHPKLQKALYWRSKDTESQGSIEGVEQILPDLRFPELGTLVWDSEMTARLVIEYGIADKMLFSPVRVNAFRIDCSQGGSVEVTFRVQTSNIPEGALDKLSHQLDGEIKIVLTPSEEPKPEVIAKKSKTPKGPKGDKASQGEWPFPEDAPSATDKFLEAHGTAPAAH